MRNNKNLPYACTVKILDIFQRKRKARINLFLKELEKRKEAEEEKFLAEMSCEYGVRPRTGREYLDDLEAIGKIRRDGNKIFYVEDTTERE